MSKIHKLELELERLQSKENGFFPVNPNYKEIEIKKDKYKEENFRILNRFVSFLNRYSIRLNKRISISEGGILFRIFMKEEIPIKRTQTERNILKEIITRCNGYL